MIELVGRLVVRRGRGLTAHAMSGTGITERTLETIVTKLHGCAKRVEM